jgi:glycerol-3-phosphate dehydrogenase
MESRTTDLDGSVHFADFGGAGRNVVLVHGLGGSHVNWIGVAPALSRRARVLAPDLVGFGRTPPAGRSSSVEANRALLDRFLSSVVGGPAVLVGNSMGGLIAIQQAALRPESVAGLVLVDPALPRPRFAPLDFEVAWRFTLSSLPGVGTWLRRRASRAGPENFVRQTFALCCADPTRIPPEIFRAHVALATERFASMPWRDAAFLEAGRSLMLTLARRAYFWELVSKIRAPVLLVHGTLDRLIPVEASRALARSRPDWTFEEQDGIGHVPQIEDPPRFVATVERWFDAYP